MQPELLTRSLVKFVFNFLIKLERSLATICDTLTPFLAFNCFRLPSAWRLSSLIHEQYADKTPGSHGCVSYTPLGRGVYDTHPCWKQISTQLLLDQLITGPQMILSCGTMISHYLCDWLRFSQTVWQNKHQHQRVEVSGVFPQRYCFAIFHTTPSTSEN